jgi:aspartyl-tRNA(Asn)/glutamyl-tRNA(Gln) amidotransferase subunit C
MVDREQVLKIAKLARLKLSEAEIKSFTEQLGSIFEFVNKLDEVRTGKVEPTCFVEPLHDPLRDDIEKTSFSQEDALRNGPKVKKGFFAVPKVIDGK